MPLSIATLLLLGSSLQVERAPAPDEAALKQAEQLVKDLFKDDFAKKNPRDMTALADKLVAQAREAKDDRTSQFVLFREAQELYAQAGDAERGLATIDEWAAAFAIDALTLKNRALSIMAKAAKTPEEMKPLAIAHLKLADSAVAADQYDLADKSAQAAMAAARKANSAPLAARVLAKSKEVADLKGRFDKVRKAKETLKTMPDDVAANTVLGQFECLVKGNWESGLPAMSKGSPGALTSAARKDLDSPVDTSAQVALGDTWWELADKEAGPARARLRARSILWYEKAAGQLKGGLAKTKVDKRLTEYRLERVHQGTWVDISDPKLYGRNSAPGSPLELGRQESLILSKAPPGEFDGYSVRVKLLSEDSTPNIQHEPRKLMVLLSAVRKSWSVSTHDGTQWNNEVSKTLPDGTEFIVTILLEGSEQAMFLDGVEIHRRPTTTEKFPLPTLIMHAGRAEFSQMKFRKRD